MFRHRTSDYGDLNVSMSEFKPINKGTDRTEAEFISANPNGIFYVPNRVYRKYFDGEELVELCGVPCGHRLLIRPLDEPPADAQNVYDVKKHTSGAQFHSRKALSSLDVDITNSVRMEPRWVDSEDGILIDFSERL